MSNIKGELANDEEIGVKASNKGKRRFERREGELGSYTHSRSTHCAPLGLLSLSFFVWLERLQEFLQSDHPVAGLILLKGRLLEIRRCEVFVLQVTRIVRRRFPERFVFESYLP